MPISRIIIDFDHTLFDPAPLKRELSAALEPHGVPQDLFWRTYRECYFRMGGGDYNPHDHVQMLKDALTCTIDAAMGKLNLALSRSGQYLFPDARMFLDRLVALNIPAVLYARGDPGFEWVKVNATGIEPYFTKIVTSTKKRWDSATEVLNGEGTGRRIFWVSHKLEEMGEVKKRYPHITPILKRRSELPLERYRTAGMLNFVTLKEIMEYLTIFHATSYAHE